MMSMLVLAEFKFGLFLMQQALWILSVLLILIVLVQRGKGGGLTGALGGMGGQSAFGTKAGDVFTRVTVAMAIIWIMLSMLTIAIFNRPPIRAAEEESNIEAIMGIGADEDADENEATDGDPLDNLDGLPPLNSDSVEGEESTENPENDLDPADDENTESSSDPGSDENSGDGAEDANGTGDNGAAEDDDENASESGGM